MVQSIVIEIWGAPLTTQVVEDVLQVTTSRCTGDAPPRLNMLHCLLDESADVIDLKALETVDELRETRGIDCALRY